MTTLRFSCLGKQQACKNRILAIQLHGGNNFMNTLRYIGFYFAFIFILLNCQVYGQQKIPTVNYADSINLGIAYSDKGAYDKASALYEAVPPGDTNYARALLEDAVTKELAEKDSVAITICYKGLKQGSEYASAFYNTIASCYISESNYAVAIKLLKDTALPKYSNAPTLYFTLGLAQYKMHAYSDAINSFEKSIDLDIYDPLSHYFLGRCCLEQGRLIPALLSLQFYLVLQPQTSRSYTTIGLIEQLVKNRYQYDTAYTANPWTYHDNSFTELDLIIRSKIAMNSQYVSNTKINYNFVKQIQLFLEQLKYVPSTGNYWMEKYVPFFTDLQQKKYLEPYLYFIMSSINDPNIEKGITKNSKGIRTFARWAYEDIAKHTGK